MVFTVFIAIPFVPTENPEVFFSVITLFRVEEFGFMLSCSIFLGRKPPKKDKSKSNNSVGLEVQK
jgi:hypothetical protein